MFTNLIESASHAREFKRRSSFFLITVAMYAVIIFAAGIVSVYAYDAQLESQTSSLELLSWVPPVVHEIPKPVRENHPQVRRNQPSNATIDPTATRPVRTEFVSRTDDPTKVPDKVSTVASEIPVYTKGAVLGDRNLDPPPISGDSGSSCVTCTNTPTKIEVEGKPPEPLPVKPPTTEKVTSKVLISKVVSLPQPAYPVMAKQTRTQGTVNIQILVDELGKVISAQVVSGHPMLNPAAKEAALRARFTPTVLNGQAVKIQGVITYNFVLQ